jgi:hypothetical protein
MDEPQDSTQPTRECSRRKGKTGHCKNRVPLDSKWKLCDHCREIGKKSRNKTNAAFRADPDAQAALAARVPVPTGFKQCVTNLKTPYRCRNFILVSSPDKQCSKCLDQRKKSYCRKIARGSGA